MNTQKYQAMRLIHLTFGDEETDTLVEPLLQGPPDDHAGNTEISLMQCIRPEITGLPDSNVRKSSTSFNWDRPLIDVFADGVVDAHPKWIVSSDIGEKLINIYSDNLTKKIKTLGLSGIR